MKQTDVKIITNRSDLIQQNELIVTQPQPQKFKLSQILEHALNNKIMQQFFRFLIYTLILIVVLSFLNKNYPSVIYSIVSKEQTERSILFNKQIPGLFPPLTRNYDHILKKWSVQLLRGPNGSQEFTQNLYQLEFKHFNEKQDVVYITKDNCNGHLIMNWKTYGNNIFFTDYVPPTNSMIIPNQPEDEACIKMDSQILKVLKYSTVWTVSEENQKTALFLLIEQNTQKKQNINYVLIANEYKKN